MDPKLVIEILLGIMTVAVAAAAFWTSTRAQRTQSQAAVRAVDAAAYERAKALYESVIAQLNGESDRLRTEVSMLHQEVANLRSEVDQLSSVNVRLAREMAQIRGSSRSRARADKESDG